MKPGKRSTRVAEQIRKELSLMVQNRLKDPRIGMVTITRVSLTDDLKYAKVYFSVLGTEAERKSSEAALGRSAGYLQRLLKDVLSMRSIPQISFKYDPSIQESIAIDAIIQRIHSEDEKDKNLTVTAFNAALDRYDNFIVARFISSARWGRAILHRVAQVARIFFWNLPFILNRSHRNWCHVKHFGFNCPRRGSIKGSYHKPD